MKLLKCRNPYCDEEFETVGFRPIDCYCPTCGMMATWFKDEPGHYVRGFLKWTATDEAIAYAEEIAISEALDAMDDDSFDEEDEQDEESLIEELIQKAIQQVAERMQQAEEKYHHDLPID